MASPPAFISPAASKLPEFRRARSSCPLRAPPRACEAPSTSATKEVDKHFSRLNHVNKNLRVKASAAIAELGGRENIERLCQLLVLEDTDHRRAAVQALGMTGMEAVPYVVDILRESDNSTVRASCAKVLAAVALYFPEQREGFPAPILDVLRSTLVQDPDPVTKIATVGCFGTLASDVKHRDGSVVSGNEKAVSVLMQVSSDTKDVAIGAAVIGAIAQIGQNGTPQRKVQVRQHLETLKDSQDDEAGFNYVREIAASHLDQLEDKKET